ncbi:MAG: type II toxin-antitoxin system prevent-host-death family antitoxin [Dehalococcoidia bacterium]|nr:type II toxin-antitoxin system prevent-host-death family antitoxin [Dehalococcoidia bacterium]
MRLLNAMSASEAKAKFYDVLTQAQEGKVIHVIRHSRPEAVVIGIEKYTELMERLETLEESLGALKTKIASETVAAEKVTA